MNDDTDAPRGPSAAAKEAAGGMEITPTRLAALRAVRDNRVQYDSTTNAFLLDGVRVTHAQRRTYGEIRRYGHIKEELGDGEVATTLTPSGIIIVSDGETPPGHAEGGGQPGGTAPLA